MFTGIEHLVVILTTVGGGIGSAIIAWYRIRKDVKRAEAEAAAAEAEAEKETPAPPMGGDASPILVARVDALDLRVIQLQADLSELKDTVEQLKSNTTVLVKLAAAALAQLPNTFCVDNLEVPEYRNPQAGSDMPAVPPTIDPVIVPTTPPIGPPLKEAQQDPSTPQENAPGAPGLPATK
jgi:hypothetical protein